MPPRTMLSGRNIKMDETVLSPSPPCDNKQESSHLQAREWVLSRHHTVSPGALIWGCPASEL